MKTQEI